jgi:hypothetical protein
MATGVVSWSTTAATNSGADSNVNWAEGQAPSSVNNSSRAEMASVAMWRDDTSGALNTAGTSTAYTLTTNQGFAALTAGYEIAFTLDEFNGAAPTINVDGLGAKPLRAVPNVALGVGALGTGTIHRATYKTSNGGEWILHSTPPAASASVAGVIEMATDAETITGTAVDRALTPANLRSMSGTYTPTGTGVTNVTDVNIVPSAFRWSRIGDIVTVAGQVNVDPTATGATEFRLTLPVVTDFGATTAACSGTGGSFTTAALGTVVSISGLDTGGQNQAVVTYTALSANNQALTLIFNYQVI